MSNKLVLVRNATGEVLQISAIFEVDSHHSWYKQGAQNSVKAGDIVGEVYPAQWKIAKNNKLVPISPEKSDIIGIIQEQLKSEVDEVCVANKFYSIESMRTHAVNVDSSLNAIALKISVWETEMNNHFLQLLSKVENDDIQADAVVFSKEFQKFVP